jgi:hypothetical protein
MNEYAEKVIKSIEAIETLDSSKGYYYEQVLCKLLKIERLPIIIYTLEANNLFFKTRINEVDDAGNVIDFNRISEISYPKREFVNEYARTNKPRQSMFYCSENRPTSYGELLSNECDVKKMKLL